MYYAVPHQCSTIVGIASLGELAAALQDAGVASVPGGVCIWQVTTDEAAAQATALAYIAAAGVGYITVSGPRLRDLSEVAYDMEYASCPSLILRQAPYIGTLVESFVSDLQRPRDACLLVVVDADPIRCRIACENALTHLQFRPSHVS